MVMGISQLAMLPEGHPPPKSPQRGYSWPAVFRGWPGAPFSHAQLLRLFFFGRLDPSKKHLRRSFFGAKTKKKTASVHQHEE